MSGGNLGRSKSLVDISSLRDSTGLVTGGVPRGSLSFCSEAEGLELLSQDSLGDPSPESHINAL
jgi:hypothetical protein